MTELVVPTRVNKKKRSCSFQEFAKHQSSGDAKPHSLISSGVTVHTDCG